MLVEDYLRPAAVAVGVLQTDDDRRFGYHNLRHALASFLVRTKEDGQRSDPRTVSELLRSDVTTTLQLCSQSLDTARLLAQEEMLTAIFRGTRW
jgi:site-specific recombinase XerD